MEWLNYHHLLYFWTVAREGGISKAAEKLRLSQPTISAQVRMLEEAVRERLFQRRAAHWCSPIRAGKRSTLGQHWRRRQ
jgi:DNA-binding transcriptional LysR family regulator